MVAPTVPGRSRRPPGVTPSKTFTNLDTGKEKKIAPFEHPILFEGDLPCKAHEGLEIVDHERGKIGVCA